MHLVHPLNLPLRCVRNFCACNQEVHMPQMPGSVDSMAQWSASYDPWKDFNPHDRSAIAARKRVTGCIVESTVGHLPKEIPQVTWFIMLYGAVVTVKVLDTHLHRLLLVQGGLEIPIQVIVKNGMQLAEQRRSNKIRSSSKKQDTHISQRICPLF